MQDEIKRLNALSMDLLVIEECRNEPGQPLHEYLKEMAGAKW